MPAAAQAAPQQPPPPPPRQEGTAEVAFVGTSGNSETSTFSVGGEHIYRPPQWMIRNRARLIRTETENELAADSLLYAYHLGVPVGGAVWPMWGGGPGRSFALTAAPAGGSVAGTDLLSPGSLVAYPNPARRQPVVRSANHDDPRHDMPQHTGSGGSLARTQAPRL